MESYHMERREEQCLPPTQPYPWLLYFDGINNNQTFCSILDPTKTYSSSIPEFGGAKLLSVQHGWFLLKKDKIEDVSELFLWNSSDGKINLPSLKHKGIGHCIFSCSPTANEQVCSIFLFTPRPIIPIPPRMYYCQLGDKQWTEVDYSEHLVRAYAVEGCVLNGNNIHLYNPVYCNGRLYAESYNHLLVVIEKLEPNDFEINSAHVFLPPNHLCLHGSESRLYLLESNHELFRVEITLQGDKIISVIVHKLDFSSRAWKRVTNIKDQMFFLSDFDLPFACQAINPEIEGGLVYFTSKQNKFVHIYNIEDNSLVIRQALSFLPKKCHRSLWLRPDIRMMTLALQEERGKIQIKGGGESSVAINSSQYGDKANNSCAFPFEIIEVVAEYLNAIDYLHFRATNSFFRLKAPLIQCRSSSHISLSPLLVFFQRKEKILTFVHPKHGIKYTYRNSLPKNIQGDCEICYSKDGWLLLAVDGFSNMLFNPFTKEVKQLAYGPEEYRNISCVGLSHSPTSPECVVVELDDFMSVYTTCLGKKVWEESQLEARRFSLYSNHPCFYKGAFYYLSNKGKLGILRVGEAKCWEECKKPFAPFTDYYKCFLVECNGSLLSVFEGDFRNLVRVYKLNESNRTWTRVKNLGDYMLFVGDQSFSAVANIPGMENKIYFPRFYGENIVFYSLETNNYHTFENSKVVDFCCMKEQLNSSWIEPRWC